MSAKLPALRAPFPWFGGKSRVAHLVWERFGDTPNYVEPFAGSLAVLLGRPHAPRVETVNDLDCYLANFWRAVQHTPEEVAHWADSPVNEADLHARHLWLVNRAEFRERMKTEPEHFDAKIAGWWVWGICSWIGGGWCAVSDLESRNPRTTGLNVWRKRPGLADGGRGVQQKMPNVTSGFGSGTGVQRRRPSMMNKAGLRRPSLQLPQLGGDGSGSGRGIHRTSRRMPDCGGNSGAAGKGVAASGKDESLILAWMLDLQTRLRRVRVCCGDWQRVLGRSVTECIGTTALFLDPPYSAEAGRDHGIYSSEDLEVAHAVRAWALENGRNPALRIALCGYEGEHEMPGWSVVSWKASGGYGNRKDGRGKANAHRERIWFSPHCLPPLKERDLFHGHEDGPQK